MPVVPAPFVEETILSPLSDPGILVENQLTVYFLTLNSIPLMYMSVFILVLHSPDYCSFAVDFEIRKCESFNFVLLFEDCLAIVGDLLFCIILFYFIFLSFFLIYKF